MENTIENLQKLHQSAQKLETVLQEVWSLIDIIGEDVEFRNLKKKAKQYKYQKQNTGENLEDLCGKIDEFDNCLEQIPEDGTAAVDFEDAISEMIEWIKNNK
jgi:molecular chaperone GrpE (heat shock protein)